MIRHNNDVYSLAGYPTSVLTNKVYRLRDGTWTAMPSMTYARHSFAAALFNNTIYVFGGYGSVRSSVEAFDIATKSWSSKAQPPPEAHQSWQAAAVYRDLIWQCGGNIAPSTRCFTYNPRTDVWTATATMTTGRFYFGLVVLGDSIYAIGGELSPKTVERYNASTNVWELLPGQLATNADAVAIMPAEQ